MNVEIINPFIAGAKKVLNDAAQIDLGIGKPYVRDLNFNDSSLRIIIGITGEMTGQVVIAIPIENALKVASNMMMGMSVPELDDMSLSALSELGNMIMGTASTILSESKVLTDITPPVLERGIVKMDIKNFENVCVPMTLDGNTFLELNIIAKKI